MPDDTKQRGNATGPDDSALSRRNILLGTSTLVAAATLTSSALAQAQKTAPAATTLRSDHCSVLVMGFCNQVSPGSVSLA